MTPSGLLLVIERAMRLAWPYREKDRIAAAIDQQQNWPRACFFKCGLNIFQRLDRLSVDL